MRKLRRISSRPSTTPAPTASPSTEPPSAAKLPPLPSIATSGLRRSASLSRLSHLQPDSGRVLDFDIECRPLSWYGGDFVTREVTAIACRFLDTAETECWALGEVDVPEMLAAFVERYDDAGLVTGHYIRGFDLPNLNGALAECGMRPLSDKLTHDTKIDLVRRSGLSSSQENLGALLGLEHPKIGMTQTDWREANRLTPAGIAKTKRRVIGDVEQHIELRARLLELGMLGPPKLWRSAGAPAAVYAP